MLLHSQTIVIKNLLRSMQFKHCIGMEMGGAGSGREEGVTRSATVGCVLAPQNIRRQQNCFQSWLMLMLAELRGCCPYYICPTDKEIASVPGAAA